MVENNKLGVLNTPIQYVKGVGPKLSKLFEKISIFNVMDLLLTPPRRYEDRANIPNISSITAGTLVTVKGKVLYTDTKKTRTGMSITKVLVSDGTGKIALVWFNQPWLGKKLNNYEGDIIAYGTAREPGTDFFLEIHSPEWEPLDDDGTEENFAKIVPIYPLTEGLSSKLFRRVILNALDIYGTHIQDALPAAIRRKHQLVHLKDALHTIHNPSSLKDIDVARKRLVVEEFLYLQLGLTLQKLSTKQEVGFSNKIDSSLLEDIQNRLPFQLTNAQNKVIHEIWNDMSRPYPMNRLVQGDVGSGKTVVAFAAMLAAVKCGHQVALMAPTEILASQHATNLEKLFADHNIEIGLLIGKMRKKERTQLLDKVLCGTLPVLVGTHAIIQDSVAFNKLGLVVIDEQHRFGVLQRAKLYEKSSTKPDVLVMTATPIPRTLTMAFYGDLDLSIIDELPAGRKPIVTHLKRHNEQRIVFNGVKKLIDEGRQAYFICPLIEESEKLQAKAATELYDLLANDIYPNCNIGLLHSQMKREEKEEIMEQFRNKDLDILVSTVVIEVGVDVPNASIMVIMDANRFGLSQLHQLRGRVGRGEHQSFCILMADSRIGEAKDRLDIMTGTNDGFKIAEADLRIRGPGEIMGTKQSGEIQFRIADLVKDADMVEATKQIVEELLEEGVHHSRHNYPDIYQNLEDRKIKLAYASIS